MLIRDGDLTEITKVMDVSVQFCGFQLLKTLLYGNFFYFISCALAVEFNKTTMCEILCLTIS